MRFDIITIFPEFFAGPLEFGIVRRAREANIIGVRVHDLRRWTSDKHKTVDDRPFGGGEGMLMKPEPLFEAVEEILELPALSAENAERAARPQTAIILLSASGKLFRQADARRLAQLERIVFLCGRYEGVDERVAEHLASDEFSIGDFVLSGGELPAAMVLDAVTRLLPGALGNEDSAVFESFRPLEEGARNQELGAREENTVQAGAGDSSTNSSLLAPSPCLLDCPHYTRPADFRGWKVPDVLLSGNHEEIRRWRRDAALEKTRRNRPDVLAGTALS
jgi:tRNA (guanine37-N1)-methyltransferase